MQTVYDWTTMIVFAGLVVLFLQRSQGEARDQLWQYMVAALGCAATNYVGNDGHDVLAVAMLTATLAFIFIVLRPLDGFRS
jgi:hypothetical protein